jgi:tripartite-type tricarboxylate transporter receptor subunit TctC
MEAAKMRRRHLLGALLSAPIAVAARGARAERAVTIVVPDLPGGTAGATVRVLQPYLEHALAAPIVLDFRPGAGGIVGLTAGARADPDGGTLTLLTPAVTLAPWISRRMDCSPADFVPIGQVSFDPAVLVVRAGAPYATVSDLLRSGARPGELAAPATAGWNPSQVAQGLFLARAGLSVRSVTGLISEAERIGALLAGDVDFAFVPLSRAVDPGVKALAVSAPARIPQMPSVPNLRELGFDIAIGAWRTLALPAAASQSAIGHFGAALKGVMENPALRTELVDAGLAPAWLGPAAAQRAVLAEYRDAGALFATLGIAVRKQATGLRTG